MSKNKNYNKFKDISGNKNLNKNFTNLQPSNTKNQYFQIII